MSEQDVIDWWESFLKSDHGNDVKTGLTKTGDDRMFLFAQHEGDIPSSLPLIRGIANLKAENASDVLKIIAPVMATAAETPQFAAQETAFTVDAYCNVRRSSELFSIPFNRVSATAPVGNEPHYDGHWFCLPVNDLLDGDKIEFGALGVRGFRVEGVWEVEK